MDLPVVACVSSQTVRLHPALRGWISKEWILVYDTQGVVPNISSHENQTPSGDEMAMQAKPRDMPELIDFTFLQLS